MAKSANGSANFPKFVTKPCARAILPSNQSVKLATAKIIAPTNWVTANVVSPKLIVPQSIGTDTIIIKIGIINILKTVNLFGKFTSIAPSFSCSILRYLAGSVTKKRSITLIGMINLGLGYYQLFLKKGKNISE
jgi:hypothetical protein